jgi:predicted enzyme related to lactoylglutathione lyase
MANIPKSGAVVFAKDPQRVARFYEVLAGLEITHSGKEIIVLESPGQQLMVHPIPAKLARTIDITAPPKRRMNAAVKLVFAVTSIAEARARAPALGGELDPAANMFEARGFRACDGHDPEGNVIQVREEAGAAATAASRRTTRKPSRRSGVDYATVRELALALPGVSDGSTLRGIAFKAGGKLLACKAYNRSAEPESLMVRVGRAERDRLIAREPDTYYLTPHYLAYECVLVRLANVDRKALAAVFAAALHFVVQTPAKVRKAARKKKAGSVFRYL